MVGNDERSIIDGVSKIKDDLQPMEVDDFDMMEDDLVMMEDDQNLLFPLIKSIYFFWNDWKF